MDELPEVILKMVFVQLHQFKLLFSGTQSDLALVPF